ncbi:MAG: RNA methyltransferase [Hyphomicrobium sp.]
MNGHSGQPRQVSTKISSLTNERIKAIRALEMRKERKETGLFVAEGASILVTARDQGFAPETLVHLAGAAESGIAKGLLAWAAKTRAEVLEVSEAVLGKLAAKDNPQTMLGVFRQRWSPLPEPRSVPAGSCWVALEDVRDPGNLGTILRTADAVGAGGVVLVGTCCDPYSRECVRATMGSIFTVPITRATREEFMAWRAGWSGDVIGTHLDGRADFRAVTYREPVLLVMGSEGPGLSVEMAAACSRLVKIPMAGSLDSLNLAVATALALYQIRGSHLRL